MRSSDSNNVYLIATSLLLLFLASGGSALTASPLPNMRAAVIVPGFLTGGNDFSHLAKSLTDRGIPTVVVPMPSWHWIPCLAGRSMRPILERLDYAVQHVARASASEPIIPPYKYNIIDLIADFQENPGGIYKVGGSDLVDEYPIVQPRGVFPLPQSEPKGKIALIGHSAGGWISRIYLSRRNYAGKSYGGVELVHSLVTLGTPHRDAPGPAFEGIRWCNKVEEELDVRKLSVSGSGFLGADWGALTEGSYAFCSEYGMDVSQVDGDGVTPIESAFAWKGAEQLVVEGVTHFCWSKVAGSSLVAPELTKDEANGRPWYGSDNILDQWVPFLQV
jgi:pimeloyl-ACP methyl ester carboxylesterase